MKILELRFSNLNSLYGDWVIDFSAPDFTANGIFAITGPTGAGKSTILDAICLALYGATPRLGRITKSSNEIMSRRTGECSAEVTFESVSGRFRCHWSQHRARRNPDGRLADARHEVVDALSGQVLESKKRDVARVIEQHTGMDFDRFTRSILLAQGGFAAFLQAKPDERAPVLEQITGTEVYSEISKRVHERQRQERQQLDVLRAETAGIELLTGEQEAELIKTLAGQQKTELDLSKRLAKQTRAIQWLTGIETLRTEIETIAKEIAGAAAAAEIFIPQREKLRLGLKAAELEAAFATLTAVRQQQKDDLVSLDKDEQDFPGVAVLLQGQETQCADAARATVRAREAQKIEHGLIKKVRALDLQIGEKRKTVTPLQTELRKVKKQLANEEQARQTVLDAFKKTGKELKTVQHYLSEHAHDEQLVSRLAGITEQLNALQTTVLAMTDKNKAITRQQKLVETTVKQHAARQVSYAARKDAHDGVRQERADAGQALKRHLAGRLLREYREQWEGLQREMVYLQRISTLEEDRKKLADGNPCPLCGSTEHPFARGNVPEMDETEKRIAQLSVLIQTAEKMKRNIQTLEDREKKQAEQLTREDKLLTRAAHAQQEAEKELQRLQDELTELKKRFAGQKQSALAGLQPFAVNQLPENDIDGVLQALNGRLKQWLQFRDVQKKIEEKQREMQAAIQRLDVIIDTLAASLKEKQDLLVDLKTELQQRIDERSEMYGAKKPDAEESRLERQVTAAERAEKTARTSRDDARGQVTAITTRITTLKARTVDRKKELASLADAFAVRCLKAGFEDEHSFRINRLLPEEKDRLQQRAQEIDEQQVSLATRKQDRENHLVLELTKNITKESVEDLREVHEGLSDSLKEIGEETGAVKQRLADNTAAREKIKNKQELIDARKKECSRWDSLHALIGSADGKRYRNFAQGITFELMVSHANLQLARMTDRYLLIRDKEQPLELNVIDNYQAGEIRSTKNLSGGESFIVSLSLALGLSRMASRKVRVDSLFLDEGFGTLDDEALETALETLSGLQQDGKLIGVISHVSALKERISTQINVFPVSEGKSMVSGPGCKNIEKMC